jgi:hypothetical protein
MTHLTPQITRQRWLYFDQFWQFREHRYRPSDRIERYTALQLGQVDFEKLVPIPTISPGSLKTKSCDARIIGFDRARYQRRSLTAPQ